MHIGRCFLLMNKHFQGGRKREEPDQPHSQAGKISPDKKAITSRHCRAKGSQQKENKPGGNTEENSTETAAKNPAVLCIAEGHCFLFTVTTCSTAGETLGDLCVLSAIPSCPITATCSSPSPFPAVAFLPLGNVPLNIFLLLDVPQLHQVVQEGPLQPFT